MKIFLAKYEHKHGTDERAFKTRRGAEWQLEQWAEVHIGDWETCDIVRMPADKLVEEWTNITGGNEFLYIDELPLLDLRDINKKEDTRYKGTFD